VEQLLKVVTAKYRLRHVALARFQHEHPKELPRLKATSPCFGSDSEDNIESDRSPSPRPRSTPR
ncbi:unnamed protein product, partial [Chrysoparadoxa australica]